MAPVCKNSQKFLRNVMDMALNIFLLVPIKDLTLTNLIISQHNCNCYKYNVYSALTHFFT